MKKFLTLSLLSLVLVPFVANAAEHGGTPMTKKATASEHAGEAAKKKADEASEHAGEAAKSKASEASEHAGEAVKKKKVDEHAGTPVK
ncbi:hypothetical protein [Magnetospira sp. QH-2]|uniref:hypothetical protein n=1 Tax=Magnetospira sp. (strain QH-2) TaxID=1288970 RepID=UPI0003E81564|nr:hypothetical protein [Magnetospira sp. QH-2]CCQ75203.1 conserved exported protein of unknown function [Magnetospira sp. QH-2]